MLKSSLIGATIPVACYGAPRLSAPPAAVAAAQAQAQVSFDVFFDRHSRFVLDRSNHPSRGQPN